MWKDLIETHSEEVQFASPATTEQLQEIEAELKITLPEELKSLLLESDGLYQSAQFVYSASELIKSNLEMRSSQSFEGLFMPFDNLLFFGEDGGGDLFAFPITKNGEFGFGIFRWCHETDSRTSLGAITLESFIEQWLNNSLEE